MIRSIIRFSAHSRALVLLAVAVATPYCVYTLHQIPLDAIPVLSRRAARRCSATGPTRCARPRASRSCCPRTPRARRASASIDAMGRQVRRYEQEFRAGLNEVHWDGTGDDGKGVRSGLYFYRLDVDGLSLSRRMALVR